MSLQGGRRHCPTRRSRGKPAGDRRDKTRPVAGNEGQTPTMCGIVGYVGPQERDPDPAGWPGAARISRLRLGRHRRCSRRPAIEVRKAAGKLQNLRTALAIAEPAGTVGIGHTRWATHGRPTDATRTRTPTAAATSTVVHNGIIENYAELREELIAEGPHLPLRDRHRGDRPPDRRRAGRRRRSLARGGPRRSLRRVTGSYAIARRQPARSRSHRRRAANAR